MHVHRLAIFASGSGTNAEAIIKFFQSHASIHVQLVLSNNAAALVLQRARNLGVEARVFRKDEFQKPEFAARLAAEGVTHLVLAGFLWLMPPALVHAFAHRIINIHPALLPKFGGKGMYGMNVHQAVKQSGDNETGITIHEVNEHYDEGKILFQARCAVYPEDTPEQIAHHVHQLEYRYFPTVIEKWVLRQPMESVH